MKMVDMSQPSDACTELFDKLKSVSFKHFDESKKGVNEQQWNIEAN
jgi:hypothetical protein